jgi:hypothetical protein
MRIPRLLTIVAIALVALTATMASPAAARSRDRNHDGIADRWERHFHLSLKVNQANRDQDRDGLGNRGEFRSHTSPRDQDTDNDGVEDADEDFDRDGVDNGNEMDEHTNPADRDSDDDGTPDGREDTDRDRLRNAPEDRTGNDPVDPDTDDDGIKDGEENAGKIVSFENGTLTIGASGGSDVVGKITAETEIKCETEDENERDHHGAPSNSHLMDQSGESGDDHSGDDSSGHGEHMGPDNELDDPHEIGDDDNVCTTADLVAGAIVHEAELKLTADGLVFKEIDLLK